MLTLPLTLTLTPSQFAEVFAANPEAAQVRAIERSGPCCG